MPPIFSLILPKSQQICVLQSWRNKKCLFKVFFIVFIFCTEFFNSCFLFKTLPLFPLAAWKLKLMWIDIEVNVTYADNSKKKILWIFQINDRLCIVLQNKKMQENYWFLYFYSERSISGFSTWCAPILLKVRRILFNLLGNSGCY